MAVTPGAGPGGWRELRREGDAVDYHAGTAILELHRTQTEAYSISLAMDPPAVFVIMRPSDDPERPWDLYGVTASAHDGLDYQDSGEEMVEPVPMPPGLIAWVSEFVEAHHKEEPFVKRKRSPAEIGGDEGGVGDARVRQAADVYRAPGETKPLGKLK